MNKNNRKQSIVSKRLQNYFEDFIFSSTTQVRVRKLRSTLKIPVRGLPGPTEKDVLAKFKGLLYYPESWSNRPVNVVPGSHMPVKVLNAGLKKILNDFEFKSIYFRGVLAKYIFHNKLDYYTKHAPTGISFPDMCLLEDTQMLIDDYIGFPEGEKIFIDHFKSSALKYPVMLHIHKDASRNDVIRYIKDKWPYVSYFKNRNTTPGNIRKTKARPNRERDSFISGKPHLSRREIKELVLKRFHQNVTLKHISVIRNRAKR